MWPKNVSASHLTAFIFVTLLISWGAAGLIYKNPALVGIAGITYAIPTAVAIALNILYHKDISNIYQPAFTGTTRRSIAFAVLYPAVFVILLAVVALASGKASVNSGNLPAAPELVAAILFTLVLMVIAFGEEYGWRGFLLPALATRCGRLQAAAIVGLIWVAYHLPAVYLANQGSENLWLPCLIAGASTFVMAFPLAYCYFQTKGSIAAVIVFRAVWDAAHSLVLGTAGSEKRALLTGNYNLYGPIPLDLALGAAAAVVFACLLAKNGTSKEEA
ncbi:MAG: CPBP family intramembrane metalloprotease [Firmicutes bacterium]|jgi:membrane protease YdiL (CAAX protease family)|nr:CPBP family intramembrane metalloprotease [Bacillota bacterium]HKM17606.1 type II CAAX endopeptidase family protein [Limnochordia bacterium]